MVHAHVEVAGRAQAFVVVELSTGMLRDDVRLALEGRRPVEFYSRVGGNVPSAEEVLGWENGALQLKDGTWLVPEATVTR